MTYVVKQDDLSGPEIQALLREHLAGMHASSPPGTVFALPLEGLRRPEVTLWSVWDGSELCACGALKQLDAGHGEVKSMRTRPAYLRKGAASAVLAHILAEARRRGYARVSLETGTGADFAPAHALYERFGFARCGPFPPYEPNGFSVFMTKVL